MKQLINWFNILIKKRKELRRWQRIVTVLAAIMTFATTYALILPAITVERNNTGEVAGMYLEKTTDREELQEENALEPAGVNIAADIDDEIDSDNDDVETDAEIPNYEEAQELDEASGPAAADDDEITAALSVKTLKYYGSDYTVNLTYDESSGIPEGANLAVFEIARDSKEYQTYFEEAKKAMGLAEGETLPSFAARFFDIKIMVDEQEFTPETGVSVEITYAEPLAEHPDTEVSAVHFADETDETEVIEANTTEVKDDGTATVEFTAEAFSVYGVIYTVDFHWEVDGKTYDFSIPGGGFVSFYDLVKILGIVADDPETEKDEIWELVDEVDSITFSDPELVSVSKVEEDTTVGAIKERLQLECEYSAELTEEQISEINAQETQAGDWALISLKPFSSNEAFTITMKNGAVWVVKVTDASRSANYIDDLNDILDANNGSGQFLLYSSKDGTNYYLKNDGSTTSDPPTEGTLPNYLWTVSYHSKSSRSYYFRGRNGYYLNLNSNSDTSNTGTYAGSIRSTTPGSIILTQSGKQLTVTTSTRELAADGRNNRILFYSRSRNNPAKLNLYFVDSNSSSSGGGSGIVIDPGTQGDLDDWLDSLANRTALQNVDKTAKVYGDYANRMYQIDITAESAVRDFDSDIDLSFIMDVSNSMKYPSDVEKIGRSMYITQGNLNTLPGDEYYIISDPANTATMYRLQKRWDSSSWSTKWYYKDASKDDSAYAEVNDNVTFKDPYRISYPIYTVNDRNTRFYYLQQSLTEALTALKSVVAATGADGDNSHKVYIAYNTFASYVTDTSHHAFEEVDDNFTITLGNTADGTRQDLAFQDAQNFAWNVTRPNQPRKKYAILITDGAPNGVSIKTVSDAAGVFKGSNGGITLITVGLSTGDVEGGSRMLQDIASDIDGTRQFYEAEKGKDMKYILLKILQTIMTQLNLKGSVSDTVDPAFYPVDPAGNPIEPGIYRVNSNGTVTALNSEPTNGSAYYVWTNNNGTWTINWYNQNIGWDDKKLHETFYVKAKENFLGGNTIETNTSAAVTPTGIVIPTGPNSSRVEPIVEPSTPVTTPYVNVDELSLDKHETEWTVYKGTNVTPKDQIRQLYNNTIVYEVVSSKDDDNRRSPGSKMKTENGFIAGTFYLKEVTGELTDPQLQTLIDTGTVDIDYTSYDSSRYGTDHVGKITLTLTKSGSGSNYNSHDTGVVGTPAETYSLKVEYKPNSQVTKIMDPDTHQQVDLDYHTTPGGSRGNQANNTDTTNKHTINVFQKGIKFTKVDMTDTTKILKEATFELFRVDPNGNADTSKYRLPTGNYTKVGGDLVVDSNGMITINPVIPDVDGSISDKTLYQPNIAVGETQNNSHDTVFYLVEKTPPASYSAMPGAIKFTMTLSEDKGNDAETALYNWTQSVSIAADEYQTGSTEYLLVDAANTVNGTNSDVYAFKIKNGKSTDITLIKVDKISHNSIGGAKFSLMKGSENVDLTKLTITRISDGTVVVPEDYNYNDTIIKVVTVPEGGIKIAGLTDDTYTLKEVSAPMGYVIIDSGKTFKMENGTIKNADGSEHQNERADITFEVENEPGAALPATGGSGTNLIYFLGIMLTGLAGTGLVMRKRRKMM